MLLILLLLRTLTDPPSLASPPLPPTIIEHVYQVPGAVLSMLLTLIPLLSLFQPHQMFSFYGVCCSCHVSLHIRANPDHCCQLSGPAPSMLLPLWLLEALSCASKALSLAPGLFLRASGGHLSPDSASSWILKALRSQEVEGFWARLSRPEGTHGEKVPICPLT